MECMLNFLFLLKFFLKVRGLITKKVPFPPSLPPSLPPFFSFLSGYNLYSWVALCVTFGNVVAFLIFFLIRRKGERGEEGGGCGQLRGGRHD